MLEFFAFVGLLLILFGVIFGFTAFIGYISDDDDYAMRWIASSVIAAMSLALYIFTNVN